MNENGVAVTCKHVIDLIGSRQNINAHYNNFAKEKTAIGKDKHNKRITELAAKYNYRSDSIIQLNEMFVGVTNEQTLSYRWINHPKYDLSIIIFDNFKNPAYQSHAVFLKDTSVLKQGKNLCRLGYPFPEFTNFRYNETNDMIEWATTGKIETPRFPIDGMS